MEDIINKLSALLSHKEGSSNHISDRNNVEVTTLRRSMFFSKSAKLDFPNTWEMVQPNGSIKWTSSLSTKIPIKFIRCD